MVTWHPTRDNEIILNVDGSSIGSLSAASFGGLFCNKQGGWIHGFADSIGVGNNLLAELLALYHGLQVDWSRNFYDLTCYSDSKNVLQLVTWHNYAPSSRT